MNGPRATPAGRPRRVVLVVGHGRDQAAIERMLGEAEFETEVAAGPVAAVLRATRDGDGIDGVVVRADSLSDEDLPAVATLRHTLPRATIVLLYGDGARERAARALLLGADAALPEPFYPVELLALLRRPPRAASFAGSDSRREIEKIGRLAGGVAHEINNPLTIISGWVQVLLSEVTENDPRYRALVAIRDEASRIARIVTDLQTYARRKAAVMAPVDVNAMVRAEVGGGDLLSRLEKRRLTLRLQEDLPPVAADAAQVREVVRHLVRNAVTATPEGGEIVLETSLLPGNGSRMVKLDVRDTGRGVPDEEKDRIFDPFFPGSPAGPGPGLGLAVSLAIATSHGGDLVLAETGESGSTFRLTLPATPPTA